MPLLALASAAPTNPPVPMAPAHTPKPPTFNLTSTDFKITSGGWKPNQGAHKPLLNLNNTLAIARDVEAKLKSRQAGSVVTGAGLNWYQSDFNTGNSGYDDHQYYYCFNGPASNFPPFQNWMNFYDMFDRNQQDSMAQEESGPIQGQIYNAIVQISQASNVDARFILAVIMQESTGNVYVGCTNNGVENCGLMQAYAGSVSYDSNNSQGSITQMVQDGTQGTASGGGLVQWFDNSESEGNPYIVARGYNSGSIDFNNLSDGLGSTSAYVSDIANRVQGWNGNDGEGYRASCGF